MTNEDLKNLKARLKTAVQNFTPANIAAQKSPVTNARSAADTSVNTAAYSFCWSDFRLPSSAHTALTIVQNTRTVSLFR